MSKKTKSSTGVDKAPGSSAEICFGYATMSDDMETQLLAHPSRVWPETDQMLLQCKSRIKRMRLLAVHSFAGRPHADIATTLGIDRMAVGGLMTQANKLFGKATAPRPMSTQTKERVEFLRLNSVLGPTECARRLGISQPSVNNLFKRYLPKVRFARGRHGGLSG